MHPLRRTPLLECPVNGQNKAASTGVYFTTSQIGFGSANPKVAFTSNTVVNNVDGFYLKRKRASRWRRRAALTGSSTTPTRKSPRRAAHGFTGTLNGSMENNWWGCNCGTKHRGLRLSQWAAAWTFDPWIVLSGSAAPNTINPGGLFDCDRRHDAQLGYRGPGGHLAGYGGQLQRHKRHDESDLGHRASRALTIRSLLPATTCRQSPRSLSTINR